MAPADIQIKTATAAEALKTRGLWKGKALCSKMYTVEQSRSGNWSIRKPIADAEEIELCQFQLGVMTLSQTCQEWLAYER